MKPALVVMAAGMGSRYGGLKQIDPVGPDGECVLEYALFDALRAGFGRVVFIVRRDIEAAFRETICSRLPGHLPVDIVRQELDDLPGGFRPPPGRTKPWGTGHAIWCCREAVREPFGVINADDFYGRDAFVRLARGLGDAVGTPATYVLVGYRLDRTLSPHGRVSRGVCDVSAQGLLRGVVEKTGVFHGPDGVVSEEDGRTVPLSPDTIVSMNMWGFTPGLFSILDEALRDFLARSGGAPSSEFFIPSVIDAMIQQNKGRVMVVPTASRWMGMTYPDDRAQVRSGVAALAEQGDYPRPLWSPGRARSVE